MTLSCQTSCILKRRLHLKDCKKGTSIKQMLCLNNVRLLHSVWASGKAMSQTRLNCQSISKDLWQDWNKWAPILRVIYLHLDHRHKQVKPLLSKHERQLHRLSSISRIQAMPITLSKCKESSRSTLSMWSRFHSEKRMRGKQLMKRRLSLSLNNQLNQRNCVHSR
jgi:hypothetical protein